MNKHYLLLFSLATLGSLSVSPTRAQGTSEPELTDGYYQVSNISHLYWIAEKVNSGELSENVNVRLTNNIQDNEINTYWAQMQSIGSGNATYTGDEGLNLWTPIGTEEHPYSGIFDGGGNTIYGIFNQPGEYNYGGVFGVVNNATIQNASIKECALSGKKASGGIVGKMTGNTTVTRCYSTKVVTNAIGTDNETDETYAGGIVGEADEGCTISHCLYYNVSDDPEIIASHPANRAGIVGHCQGSIYRCLATSGRGDTEIDAICPQVGHAEDCYYEKDCFSSSESGNVKAVLWADIITGRICYLLNQDLTNVIWYQDIERLGYCMPVPYPGFLGFTKEVVKLPCGLYVNEVADADTPYNFICLSDSVSFLLAEGQTIKTYGVKYSREIDPMTQWHSLCLPFDIETDADRGYNLYTFRELKLEEGDSTLYLSPVDVLPANTPGFCFISIPDDQLMFYTEDEEHTVNLTLSGLRDTIDLAGDNWQMYGVSQRTSFAEASDDDPYRMMFLSKNKLVYGVHPFNVSPYRAVIRIKNDGSQPAAALRIGISADPLDNVTALTGIEQKGEKDDLWYDLYGRKREGRRRGLYLSKHKKMMIQ